MKTSNTITDVEISAYADRVANYGDWMKGCETESANLREAAIRRSDMFCLRDLYERLSELDGDIQITHENGELVDDTFDSYRGYYRYLALGSKHKERQEPITAEQLMEMIEDAVKPGNYFIGYKGGEFRMTWDTPIWASEYGECSGKGIYGVSDDGVLLTLDAEEYLTEVHDRWFAKVRKPKR